MKTQIAKIPKRLFFFFRNFSVRIYVCIMWIYYNEIHLPCRSLTEIVYHKLYTEPVHAPYEISTTTTTINSR